MPNPLERFIRVTIDLQLVQSSDFDKKVRSYLMSNKRDLLPSFFPFHFARTWVVLDYLSTSNMEVHYGKELGFNN